MMHLHGEERDWRAVTAPSAFVSTRAWIVPMAVISITCFNYRKSDTNRFRCQATAITGHYGKVGWRKLLCRYIRKIDTVITGDYGYNLRL
jgi:hypothetical protein